MAVVIPLRAAIMQSRQLSERYRKQLLRQYDFVLLAIIDLCRAEPDWSAGKVSASLQGTCPGLQERVVAELRKVIGAKHAKRRGGKAIAIGPNRRRLKVDAAGYKLGAWYRSRSGVGAFRQFVGIYVDRTGEIMVVYRLPVELGVFSTTYRSWGHWHGGDATGCRTVPENGLQVQANTETTVECEAA